MQVIKCLSENIECTLDAAEENIKKAIKYKEQLEEVVNGMIGLAK